MLQQECDMQTKASEKKIEKKGEGRESQCECDGEDGGNSLASSGQSRKWPVGQAIRA